MANKRLDIPNLDNLIQRYVDGESALKLANEIGVSDLVIRRRLKERGIVLRSRNAYPPHVEEAHAASRGRKASMGERIRRAITRERLQCGTSRREDEFVAILEKWGIPFTRQKAIGPYNIDVALTEVPIAVEVSAGGGAPRRRAIRRKRIEYILDRGWTLVEVKISGASAVFSPEVADHIIATADILRRNPSAPREYRMVRADGKLVSHRRRKTNSRP